MTLEQLKEKLLDLNDKLYIVIRKLTSVNMPYSKKNYSKESLKMMEKTNPTGLSWINEYDDLIKKDNKLRAKFKELTGKEWKIPLPRV